MLTDRQWLGIVLLGVAALLWLNVLNVGTIGSQPLAIAGVCEDNPYAASCQTQTAQTVVTFTTTIYNGCNLFTYTVPPTTLPIAVPLYCATSTVSTASSTNTQTVTSTTIITTSIAQRSTGFLTVQQAISLAIGIIGAMLVLKKK